MFFSLDLLSIRGGKMNTIWLLGTLKEKDHQEEEKRAAEERPEGDLQGAGG